MNTSPELAASTDSRWDTKALVVQRSDTGAAQAPRTAREVPATSFIRVSEDVILGVLRVADAFSIGFCGLFSFQILNAAILRTGSELSFALVLGTIPVVAALLQRAEGYSTARQTISFRGFTKALGFVALIACPFFFLSLFIAPLGGIPRMWAPLWLTLCACAFAVIRVAAHAAVLRWTRSGRLSHRIALYGAGPSGREMARRILSVRRPHLTLIGIFDDRRDRVPREIEGFPVLGGLERLIEAVGMENGGVDEVVVALPWSAQARIQQICDRLDSFPIDVRVVGEPNVIAMDKKISSVIGLPLVHLVDRPLSPSQRCQKAILDFGIAALALTLLGPLMWFVGIAIRLDSPGPIFFRQPREGCGGRVFQVFKFRTMYEHLSDPGCVRQSSKSDPRVTRIGYFLRRTYIDELPQFINVLRGEMSVVGPRPHAIGMRTDGRENEQLSRKYGRRRKIKPGLTGWAQIKGLRGPIENQAMLEARVECDLYYTNNWSLFLDLQIIAMTAFQVASEAINLRRSQQRTLPPEDSRMHMNSYEISPSAEVGDHRQSVWQDSAAVPQDTWSGRRCSVLGMLVDELNYESVLARVRQFSANSSSRYVCMSNVHMVMECHDNAQFRTIVNDADLVSADGAPVMWASRWLGLRKQHRVCGPDLTVRLCDMAAREGVPVGFYGSTPEIADALLRNVTSRFPTLKVPVCHSPPFRPLTPEEDDQIVRRINEAGVRILFVGLGCPKQERWMSEHRGRIFATMLGAGYAFDVLAGAAKRAPIWTQKIGMEWLYRLAQDPKKLWRRHLKHNPRFVALVLRQLLHQAADHRLESIGWTL